MAEHVPHPAHAPARPSIPSMSRRATVDVTVLDLPEEVLQADVEARLEARLDTLCRAWLSARMNEITSSDERLESELRALEAHGHDLPDDQDRRIEFLQDHLRDTFLLRRRSRLVRRAKAFCERKNRVLEDVLAGLVKDCKEEDRARLRGRLLRLAGTVPAVTAADEAQADEWAAALHGEMPWMAPATEHAWHAMRRAARDGAPLRVGPLLLDGPPGLGKTTWAHRLSSLLALPAVEIDASKGLASFSLSGTERGWSTSQPGRPLDCMMNAGIANPLILVDEVDKARSLRGASGASAAFEPALLGLLEPESARSWDCPFHRLTFDMSYLSWVLTSNVVAFVSAPVLSRVQVVEIAPPTVDHLRDFAAGRAAERGLPEPAAAALCEAVGRAGEQFQLSLRDVGRMLARAEDLASSPTLH